ncbi:MAG: methyltransferase family protein [Candidatus Helarchaeota archaeon]
MVKTQRFVDWAKTEKSKSKKIFSLIIGAIIFLFGLPLLFILITPIFYQLFQNLICAFKDTLPINFPWYLILGVVIGVIGLIYALWSIITQYTIGKGTPIPSVPTTELVIEGPYKYSRNPMAFGTFLLYIGLALSFNSMTMLIIIIIFFFIPLLLFIKFIEEKELSQRFGENYIKYRECTSFIIPFPVKESKIKNHDNQKRKQPPLWLFIIVFFVIFLSIPVGLTLIFDLPLFLYEFPQYWGIITGAVILSIGLFFIFRAIKDLKVHRALGKEIYKSKDESKLITTGIYAYTRNPLYFGAVLSFLGYFLITLLLILLIMTCEYTILFIFVCKWEEKELISRFGEEYIRYKEKVPIFMPLPKKQFKNEA